MSAVLHPVARMLIAIMEYVHVCPISLAILTLLVDLNALSTPIVPAMPHVFEVNASILAPVLVVQTLFATWSIIYQCVAVQLALLETHSSRVPQLEVCLDYN